MVRRAEKDEVKHFQLWHEENAGSEFVVSERDGQVVGFAQFDEGHSDATIHFMEAATVGKGIGSELIGWFKETFEKLTTTNTNLHCQKFLESKGFEVEGNKDWEGNARMNWFVE